MQTVNEYAKTRALLTSHYHAYPALQAEDVFKFLFHSAFGCDHLVSDEQAALRYIQSEYASLPPSAPACTEPLDGAYSRVHLGVLQEGLHPGTLARLFFLSAKPEPDGKASLVQKLAVAQDMIERGDLPLDPAAFAQKLDAWRVQGFPAVHHSEIFRKAYHPAYRVIANRYAELLPILTAIDKQLAHGSATVAIEGSSASGKSTLADTLQQIYNCTVLHTDDFFLRPEQRTPERLAEIGGNLDRERFADEIVHPLTHGDPIRYRRFDCMTQTLAEPITVPKHALTVIEGAYSLHPYFGKYYDLAIFLDIDPEMQKKRIGVRNSPMLAKRFFDEWIPMENAYFAAMDIKTRADLIMPVGKTV